MFFLYNLRLDQCCTSRSFPCQSIMLSVTTVFVMRIDVMSFLAGRQWRVGGGGVGLVRFKLNRVSYVLGVLTQFSLH